MSSPWDDITVHCLVRNEENWIWFALQASLPFCRRMLLWDTGSNDRTLEIVRAIGAENLEVREVGLRQADQLLHLRNQMIGETRTPWFAVVDGDEVWPPALWLEIAESIGDSEASAIVVRVQCPFPRLGYFHAVDDVDFAIAGVRGSYSAKVFRCHPEVLWDGELGHEFLRTKDGRVLTRGSDPGMRLTCAPLWHMTMLERSCRDSETLNRRGKLHVDPEEPLLLTMPRWTEIPEVFLRPRPPGVLNPFLAQCPLLVDRAPIRAPTLGHL